MFSQKAILRTGVVFFLSFAWFFPESSLAQESQESQESQDALARENRPESSDLDSSTVGKVDGLIRRDDKDKPESRGLRTRFKNVVFDTKGRGKLRRGLTIEHTVRLPQQSFKESSCEPQVSISYLQMGLQTRVDATVVNEDCDASQGAYTVRVRSRNASGEVTTREYEEIWSRKDATTFETTHYYDLLDDLDLIWARVRTRSATACECVGSIANAMDDIDD